MAEHVHGIFRFIDPPDTAALQQCIDAIEACTYPWERCLPELEKETSGLVPVIWADSGQGNTGTYTGGTRNLITLNNRYAGRNYSFTMLHEAGHMVNDTALRDDQRVALLEKWHADDDGRWTGDENTGMEWGHERPHTHSEWSLGWRVSDAGYYQKPNEAFADAFVAAFAPTYFPYVRFAHWSNDIEGVRAIILSEPEPPRSPFADSTFPNDSIYRLYRAYFLREPDRGGYDYWKSRLAAGMTLIQVSDGFAASSEFRNRYGSLTNDSFVRLVYQNVLERAADAGGLAYWLDRMKAGMTRGQVMVGFSESAEFVNKINAERK